MREESRKAVLVKSELFSFFRSTKGYKTVFSAFLPPSKVTSSTFILRDYAFRDFLFICLGGFRVFLGVFGFLLVAVVWWGLFGFSDWFVFFCCLFCLFAFWFGLV